MVVTGLELGDSALYYCTLQGLRLGTGVTAGLVFGKGTQLTVEPNNQISSVPEVIVMKSNKQKEDGSTGKAACLARNFNTKEIDLEMSPNDIVYEQSTPILTSEGYDTLKVVNVSKDTEVTCMASFKGRNITANATLPEKEAEEPVRKKVCNTTGTSVQADTKVEKVNMLSMAVLGLRVLLAKSIAFNTLMSIKLFLF